MININKIQSYLFKYPIKEPVITSFGFMKDRPMLLVKVMDKEGIYGWGEVWCNFPSVGAEHRFKLIESVFIPLLLNKKFQNPKKIFNFLTYKTQVLRTQTGEIGPISQCIAGLDIAFNDLFAKKENIPLWRKFGGKKKEYKIYSSGINPKNPEKIVEKELLKGITAFKLKVGFGSKIDIYNLNKLKSILNKNNLLMVDANQAWNLEEAIKTISLMEKYNLFWLEEPLIANSKIKEWKKLKKNIGINLAAGENIFNKKVFSKYIKSKLFSVLQPDIAKWGGFSKCIPLIEKIVKNKILYCPHYLGGGIGLVASMHTLSASNNNGLLEVDVNPNPLRSDLVGDLLTIKKGMAVLSNKPGLGIEPNLKDLKSFLILNN